MSEKNDPIKFDLGEIMGEELRAILQPQAVREMVKKNLGELCERAVKNAFNAWGEGPGKLLTEKIKEALEVDVKNVDLSTAGLGMVSLVEQEVNRHLREQVDPIVKQRLNDLFESPPKETDLHNIVAEYKSTQEGLVDSDEEQMGLVFDIKKGYITVGLHPTPQRDKLGASSYSSYKEKEDIPFYSCDILIRLKEEGEGSGNYKVWLLTLKGLSTEETIPAPALTLSVFERKLYQMFVAGTMFKVDSTDAFDYDTTYPEPECEC